jgi:hypothetical protein
MITFEQLKAMTAPGSEIPQGLSPELQALWLCETGRWEAAHEVAQEILTPTGSWIHALLHLIEGDECNAAYWFHRAGKPVRRTTEIKAEWEAIARSLTASTRAAEPS